MVKHIENCMTDPFKFDVAEDGVLINVATGMLATLEVQTSLLTSVNIGEQRMFTFANSTLSGPRSLYSPITKNKLITFTDLQKKTSMRVDGKIISAGISAETVFRRALKLAQSRPDISLPYILSFPVTTVPPAMFHEDGSCRKTTKADLIHVLENKVTEVSPRSIAAD